MCWQAHMNSWFFRNLNAQLSRRSIDVHLPRYRAEVKDERLAFQNVLLTFQRQLPLEEASRSGSHSGRSANPNQSAASDCSKIG